MTATFCRKLIETAAARIFAATDELTELDQAIGDGDHGLNMRRGFQAVMADIDKIADLPIGEALQKVGMTMVMKVGGASGPLYGTLFMTLGKVLPSNPELADVIRAMEAAIDAVKARGKSDFGAKTLLDVLGPVLRHVASPGASAASIRSAAANSAQATVTMKALKGRASFLGERSIGHLDPGARSCQILVEAVCDVVEETA